MNNPREAPDIRYGLWPVLSLAFMFPWIALFLTEYYVCGSLEDTKMKQAVAIDVIRWLSQFVLMGRTSGSTKDLYVNMIFAVVCIAILIWWSALLALSCDDCIQTTADPDARAQMIGNMFKKGVGKQDVCNGPADESDYWYNPKNYCQDSAYSGCPGLLATTQVSEVASIQRCVRFGCTDYLEQGQWANVMMTVSDAIRVAIFFSRITKDGGDSGATTGYSASSASDGSDLTAEYTTTPLRRRKGLRLRAGSTIHAGFTESRGPIEF